jgi:hypothetical protein
MNKYTLFKGVVRFLVVVCIVYFRNVTRSEHPWVEESLGRTVRVSKWGGGLMIKAPK